MVTMRDAIEAYNKRYYDGKGEAMLEDKGYNGEKRPFHDMCHVIASGIANFNIGDCNLIDSFKFLDKTGLVARNAGMKAEMLEYIYNNALAKKTVSKDDIQWYFSSIIVKVVGKFTVPHQEQSKSHIAELHDIISDKEIIFHTDKARELAEKLERNHPECCNNSGSLDFDKLLDLDLNEFAINNFTIEDKKKFSIADKIRFRDIDLDSSTERGI